MSDLINQRKSEHIQITLDEKVTGDNISTGFETVKFIHNALPEIDFEEIRIDTNFLDISCKTPFLISSMTGGAALAESINRNLAEAAEAKGWVLALGSTRALIESKEHRSSFQVRKYAPSIPIIANLGAVQLNYGFGIEECKQIIDMTEANSLVLHLNSIQEVIQQEGNTNFKDLLGKIESLCSGLGVPVGVKEVGWGIDGITAKKLCDIGISFIDVAGAGGTSWSQVENFRSKEPIKRQAADAFSEWGIPTVECIMSVREHIEKQPLIASGGMQTGLDGAKADSIGSGSSGLWKINPKRSDTICRGCTRGHGNKRMELRMAMFGIGAGAPLKELQKQIG